MSTETDRRMGRPALAPDPMTRQPGAPLSRRDFVAGLGGAAATFTVPQILRAAGSPPLVGVIIPGTPPRDMLDEFRAGLRDLGYVDGRNIKLVVRWDRGDNTRYRTIAAEFARLPLRAVYAPRGTALIDAMKSVKAKKTPPIVGLFVTPLATGVVDDFARHGLTVTGINATPPEIYGKRLQLLKEAAPKIRRVAALIYKFTGYEAGARVFLERLNAAATSLGIAILPHDVSAPEAVEAAIVAAVRDGADGLIVTQGPFFRVHRKRLAAAAAAHRLPSVSGETGYAASGGLMEYGPSLPGISRDCAALIDKILKDAKPSDLPIEQASKVNFAVNLKTAKALGIELPRSILLRATEVIE